MSQATSIEWTDVTWNPVHGCSKVSPGCAHCYAETLSRRYGFTKAPWTPANAEKNVTRKPHKLDEPLRWRKPRMVFVNSMSDLFHENVPDEYITEVFGAMGAAAFLGRGHTFQVLTKRAERMHTYMHEVGLTSIAAAVAKRCDWGDEAYDWAFETWPLPNVWLGVSIENRRFVHRADLLRDTPAAVRFISAEPLLGPLIGTLTGPGYPGRNHLWTDHYLGDGLDLTGIDWLIVGGESGPGYRPMDPEWARDLRTECSERGTAFFMKQLGGARPGTKLEDLPEDLRIREFPERAA